MSITVDDVKKIASLAGLRVTSREIEKYRRQLAAILEYMEKLNELETDDVDPTHHVLDQLNVFREDEVLASLSTRAATANAPEAIKGYFAVPKVIEQDQDAS